MTALAALFCSTSDGLHLDAVSILMHLRHSVQLSNTTQKELWSSQGCRVPLLCVPLRAFVLF